MKASYYVTPGTHQAWRNFRQASGRKEGASNRAVWNFRTRLLSALIHCS